MFCLYTCSFHLTVNCKNCKIHSLEPELWTAHKRVHKRGKWVHKRTKRVHKRAKWVPKCPEENISFCVRKTKYFHNWNGWTHGSIKTSGAEIYQTSHRHELDCTWRRSENRHMAHNRRRLWQFLFSWVMTRQKCLILK